MKKNKIKECVTVLVMLFLVCFGYAMFYNKAFSGYEAQGTYIWLSASTVKFVNNWLKEGPLKLNFIMYEYPDSIEFNSTVERGAYISYPPGAIIPPYILAKLLHKSEIQVGFIKQFLKIKFLFDTLLVCLVFYSIFRVTLRLSHRNMIVITSIVLSLSWMCLPINLYYLRNVFFADQCIITVVLFFVLLEICNEYFSKKPTVKYLYQGFKFILSMYGVLTDWYFLFVLFVSWLVKIIPLIKSKDNFKKIILESLVYVLPVLLGIGLFFIQIMQVPNYYSIVLNKMKARIYSGADWNSGNKLQAITKTFINNYSFFGILLVILLVACISSKSKSFFERYKELFSILAIIYLPPGFQVFVLQQHSAVHEFSLLKFALPVIFTILVLFIFLFDLKKMSGASFLVQMVQTENEENLQKIKVPVPYLIIITISISSILFTGMLNKNKSYYIWRIGGSVSYERENLIRSNYSFSDVYFSFTESIDANPPQYLAVSKKIIYKIDSVPEIFERFPNLKPDARILLMVNKGDLDKSQQIIENEQDALKIAEILFSSKNYDVYEINRNFRMENANAPIIPLNCLIQTMRGFPFAESP